MVTENINIDVRPGGIPIVIHVTQYEVGLRQFIFTPYTSNGTQTVVAGSATLEGTKPDGYAFQQACEMVDGVITYTLQEQLCAVEGRVWSRLVIRDTDGGMIGYTAIVWVVGRAGVADDAVMSDSDISALRQFLDEFGGIDAYRGALNGALAAVGGPLVAATASAMTDTTKVYVYTGSESGYTEGHWYYWNGSAWTDGGVYQSTGINTDKTLTVEDMAADAKATGDAVAELKNETTELKSALGDTEELSAKEYYLINAGKTIVPAVFIHGTFAGGVFKPQPVYNYRVGMPNYIEFDYVVTLRAADGYKMRVDLFDASGVFSNEIDNVTEYIIRANQKFSITIKNTINETAHNKADLPAYVSSVTMELKPFKDIDERFDNDEAEFVRITKKLVLKEPTNLLNENAMTVGYITKNGTVGDSSSYKYTELIPVSPGDVYSIWSKNGSTINTVNARFTCAYGSNKSVVSSAGSDSNITTYTVPSGISFVRFSIAKSALDLDPGVMIVKGSSQPVDYSEWFEPYYIAGDGFIENQPQPTPVIPTNKGYYFKRQNNLNAAITFPTTSIVKNIVYAFSCNVSTMGTIFIGQGGSSSDYSSLFELTATKATFIVNGSRYEQNHNLNISGRLTVKIAVNDATKATVTVEANGQTYTRTLGWYGFSRNAYTCNQSGATVSNVSFSISFQDIDCKNYVFGDSYTAILESDSKWTHYLVADGYGNNILLNAIPGGNGSDALTALNNILENLGTPNKIMWCNGMNDGADSNGEPNENWLSRVNALLEICENNGIEPILATIPTVPTINHEAKNEWVRASGYRYIDFAKAVGASSSGVWYEGMLSSDGIHPSALGAKSLYAQVLCDAPEVTIRK